MSIVNKNIRYSPKAELVEKAFNCAVPLNNTRQLFIIDGKGENSNGFNYSLEKNVVEEKLLQVIAVREDANIPSLEYKSNINLASNSSAKLLFCSHTITLNDFKTKENIIVNLEQGANLDLVIMQNEHNRSIHSSDIEINMAADAVLKLYLITLHGGEISNKMDINFNGKGAEAYVNGLYLAGGEQKVSTTVNVYHRVPNCTSKQLFKGILEDNSQTFFNGTVYVEKDAQKTQAYQANNNILSSPEARAYTQPHLEIYADDVKCSHGATIGSLDENELFYMRSRGIELAEAKLLQQQAFASAVLNGISNEQLKERLMSLVESRLRGEFSHCSNCSKHCC